jgi:hypothetical protein
MNFKTWKLLVVKSDDALKEQIAAVLSDAGYEVSADFRDGMKGSLPSIPTRLSWVPIHLSSIAGTSSPKSRAPSTFTTYAS